MFKIDSDLTIHVTRGDAIIFSVSAVTDGDINYTFQVGDLIRLKVFERKACHSVALQKDIYVTEESETVSVFLSGEDTKIGEYISKPKDYWYEVELNSETAPQTIIGYDEDGGKVFRLYPEGGDIE